MTAAVIPYVPDQRAVNRSMWRRRLWKTDPHCAYCRQRLTWSKATLDHRIPRSQGGGDDPDNLVLACEQCNLCKGARTVEEWVRDLLRCVGW